MDRELIEDMKYNIKELIDTSKDAAYIYAIYDVLELIESME